MRTRFWLSHRVPASAVLALLVCLALAATAVSTHSATASAVATPAVCGRQGGAGSARCRAPSYGTRQGTAPSTDGSISVLRYARYALGAVEMAFMFTVFLVGFLVFGVLLPTASYLVTLLMQATTSIKAATALALAFGVFGLYYFRYSYAAPKKSTKDPKDDLKGANHSDTGFDLHPDVTRSDETDGSNYMASLEARGSARHHHGGFVPGDSGAAAAGVGFPADFLNMFMKSISIFGYIEEPVFHEFSRQLQTRRLLAGERMFENDEDRDDQNFYVVIEGQVQIYLADGSSAEPEAHSPHAELYSQRQHGTMSTTASSLSDSFDDLAMEYSSDMDDVSQQDLSDSEQGAGAAARPADAILLNVIGPGDVLSSLFSILSLFTEGVPLRQGEQPSAAASAAFRGAKSSDQQEQQRQQQWPPAEYTPDGNQQQSIHHVAESIGTRASQQTPPPLAQGLYAGPLNIHAHPDTVSAGASDAPPLPASAFAHARGGRRSTKPARPNVVARATADTTLAMIPANAFQRVTRLYPKAAAHILQVILTRLQRVTFATLYGYLDVPNELVAVERAINELAKCPLKDELQLRSSTLQSVRDIFSRHAADPASRVAPHSPTLSGGGSSLHVPKSSITSDPTANYARHFSTSSTLQPSWKVTHQRLVALSMQTSQKQTPPIPAYCSLDAASERTQAGIEDVETDYGRDLAQAPMAGKNSHQGHRRAGSDTVPSSSVPAAEAIESLRKAVLHQLCASIGLNAYSVDGRYSSPSLDRPQRSQALPSAAATPGYNPSAPSSRRSSTNRKLPRTEHLLPVLQNLSLPSQKRSSASTPPLPLAEIPSLVNELELYHLPDSFALIEQGQRPDGLYIVLDGKVEITPRGSVAELGGTGKKASMGGDGASEPTIVSISKTTRLMTKLAHRANAKFERSEKAGSAHASKQPSADAPSSPLSSSIKSFASTFGIGMSSDDSARSCTDNQLLGRHHHHHALEKVNALRSYTARAGELVGYLPALTDMTSLYTARSKGPVLVGFISRWALDRICERYPIILMTLARRLTSQLPPAILNIDYALEWVQVKASEMVYRRGETSDAVYVVLTGRLRAFVEKDNGSISILAEYGQGQSVGEPNLLLNEPCKFNLHAIRDTELVRIPTALFKALMQTAPGLTFHLSRTLAVRTAQSLQQQQLVEQQLSRHSNEGYSRLRGTAGAASIESGIRSHNKNLKSIAIIPVNSEVPVRAFAQQLEEALTTVAGSVALLDHTTASRVLGRHAFSRIARLKIVSWIAELEQRCRLLLHVADGGISSPWTRHCVRHSDFILLVGLGDGDPSVGEFERLLLALKTTARKELVLLHENRTCATGSTRKWLKQRPWVHAHHHMQMPLDYDEFGLGAEMESRQGGSIFDGARTLITRSILQSSRKVLPALTHGGISKIKTSIEKYYNRLRRSKQFTPASYQGHRSDFARLARYLCGKSVGVVLSGGGARGIALLGVLRAFEEAGIPVDMVGGTSIGAFMSGLYAQHPDSVAIHGPVKAFSRRMSSMWRFLLDITYPILSYTSGREFNRAIWKVFKESEIEDLWLPFYCMTANITQSRSEVHTTGLLWRVVRASMSLSGFVPPLCDENGDMLVDGGYLDNLPVRVMKSELGADMIFAVDIAGENDTSPVRYGASVSGIWVLLNHLNPLRSYWIPTLSEVQSRLTYASSDKELESAKVADSCVYLRVPPRDVGVLDFGRFDELYKRGYEYAKEWTARWQRASLLDQWQAPAGELPANVRVTNPDTVMPAVYSLARRNSI